MSDLISREKALALVMSVCDDLIINCGSHYDEEADGYVLDDIKECDAILKCNKGIRTGLRELPDEPRWIPISEGLPKEKINEITGDLEYVLCSMKYGDVAPYRFGSKIGEEEGHFWGRYGGIMDEDVLAWMYLPEKYVSVEEMGTEE